MQNPFTLQRLSAAKWPITLVLCLFVGVIFTVGSCVGCQPVHDFFLGKSAVQPATQPAQLSELDKFRKDLTVANDSYTTTLDIAMKAVQAGWITKDTLKEYEQYRLPAKEFLDKASAEAVKADNEANPAVGQTLLKSFWDSYYKYMEIRNAKAPSQPASQPVTPPTNDRPNFVPDQP